MKVKTKKERETIKTHVGKYGVVKHKVVKNKIKMLYFTELMR